MGDGLQENGKHGGDIREKGIVIAALSKTPGLDKIREANGIIIFSGSDLLIAIGLENLQFLRFLTLAFCMAD